MNMIMNKSKKIKRQILIMNLVAKIVCSYSENRIK